MYGKMSGIYDISRVNLDNNFNITSNSYDVINGDFEFLKKHSYQIYLQIKDY